MRARKAAGAVGLAVAAVFLVWAAAAGARQGSLFKPPARSRGGVVASASRLASLSGLEMLNRGGNATDAAVTTMFAVGVTRPELCDLGSGGFLVYRSTGGETAALDFRETAPAKYTYGDGIFAGPLFKFGTGHNVIGVPGMVAGAAAALERYGTRPLAATIAPAEKLARDGVPVTPEQSAFMGFESERMRYYPETARIYLKGGVEPYQPGERLVQSDYADSLRLVAQHGPDAFYKGQIAKAIASDMQLSGAYPGDRGTMTLGDLAAYRAKWRKPVRGTYRGYGVVGMPPPSSGGLASVEILNVLEGFDLKRFRISSADRFHLVAEAQKIAWADRDQYVADPDFVTVPRATMASKRYAAKRRAEISRQHARTYKAAAGAPGLRRGSHSDARSGETTNVAVIDRWGNAAAINCSIEQTFGSAVTAPGTGFPLNNQLTDFGPPGTANEPEPRKRPRSSQSPLIVTYRGKPALVLGGGGGSSIIMGVTNAVINHVDYGLGPARAVDTERADARGVCNGDGLQLCIEDGRVLPDVLAKLRSLGHAVQSRSEPSGCTDASGITDPGKPCEYWFGTRVQAAATSPRTGERLATSDPRNEIGGVDRSNDLGAFGQATPRFVSASIEPRAFRVPDGATIRYSLSEAARVTFAIRRLSTGRTVARFARVSKAGASSVRFSGRVGGKALRPGRYRMTLTATDAAGVSSRPKRLAFVVE
jgi:gamma-glutamyltranspeptidase/glutathione hydrolase